MIESISGALNILGVLLRPKGIREIARELDVAPPTVHARLRTLAACDMVEQDRDKHYRLGPMALSLGCGYLGALERRCRVLTRARQLSQETGYSVQVGVLLGSDVVIVAHEPISGQTPELGLQIPAHACALGKAILAFHPAFYPAGGAEATARTWTLDRLTDKTIRDLTELRRQLDSVRDEHNARHLVAEDDGEAVVGGCGIASPLREPAGGAGRGEYAIGAIGLIAPSPKLPDEGARSELRRTANLISGDLGARD